MTHELGRQETNGMNGSIQRARDVALEILKPSQRDLEHGLELHESSLVIESYGFSPRSAVDGDAVRAAAEAGASELALRDLMEDQRMTRCVTDAKEREEYLAAWEAAGVTCILQNAGEEGNAPLRLIKRLARFTYVTDMLRDSVARAATPEDILAAKEQGKHCLYMMCNGVPLPQEWVSVEEELRYIRVFFQLGCRMMHLTYNRRNMIGEGCAEPANAGLSDFGRAVVAEMNRVGVIVDVAHTGWQTCLDVARVSERPVVASHSGCAALNPHHRCKPDDVIRAIVDTGGTIGICCVPAFLGGSGDVYQSSATASEYRKIPARRRARTRWEAFWHEDDPIHAPEWNQETQRLSMAWTNWPLFTVGMVQRGYSDADVQKILGGNVLRVARAVLA